MSLFDKFGRPITDLRISVTDRCNFRCVYCRSADPDNHMPHHELLEWDEFERLARILVRMGIQKVRVTGGETVYAIPELPKDRVVPEEQLRRVLTDWVVEIAHSANLVVVRTPPGSAHVVASALDRAGLPGILGTVAGDDTLLVVVSEKVGGERVARRLQALCGL